MADSLEKSAILALLLKHAGAWYERERIRRAIDEGTRRMAELDARIADCDTSFRVFGYDVTQDGVWKSLVKEFDNELKPHLRQFGVGDEENESAQQVIPPPEQLPIHQIVLDRLKEAGDTGIKAAPIRAHVEKLLRREIHEKTVGMTLYRLLQKGAARRNGHTWFYVEPEGETENPGGETPGSFEDLLG